MGKNLTWLIDEAKQPTRRGDYYYDVWQTIMMDHGEALIDALERLLEENEDYIRINNLSAMGNVNLVNARTLLAQLESEAQP